MTVARKSTSVTSVFGYWSDSVRLALLGSAFLCFNTADAQDANTTSPAYVAPVFERIDRNGIDLRTGQPRVSTPILQTGSDENRQQYGLTWVGTSWSVIERPSVWFDGNKYTVNYRGQSEEFNNRSQGYSQRPPVTGASFNCLIWATGLASECFYTDRFGDVVRFRGRPTPTSAYFPSYAYSTYGWGNLGMAEATVFSVDRGARQYGNGQGLGDGEDYDSTTITVHLGGQTLTILTPNITSDGTDNSYLRPKNTTQTITDTLGSAWQYTFNGSRMLMSVKPPGGASATTYVYNGDSKIYSVTNAEGTWYYNYSYSGNYGTTTVTSPLGSMSYATYYRDRGYVTEVGDALGRVTKYSWDDNYHLVHVTYPELNSVDYVYDARGNVTSVKTNPKPSVGGPVLLQTAMFDTVCSDIVICNQPRSVTDALGGTTNYGYQASASASLLRWGGGNFVYQTGTGKPISVFRPAPTLGAPRPQVQNTYVSGVLTRSSICKTLSVCAGTSDEVVTTFGYGGTEGGDRLLFEKTVAFSPSVVERTCYVPDQYGHRVSETPANSGLASCPTTVATAPPATSTLPSPGTTPSTPVFP